MDRREFLQALAAASAAGMAFPRGDARAQQAAEALYDAPPFGQVSLLHLTDTHAQLRPIHFREPNVNLGVAGMMGRPPHLVGEAFLKEFGVPPGGPLAHAHTYLDFTEAAARYGRMGGYAHLATLVKQLRASRPGALLLDGGDALQGSGPALWTKGQDVADAMSLLGFDALTLHWECTYGQDRVLELAEGPFGERCPILAQNCRTLDFDDPVFKAYVIREVNGVPVAIIGQAFPYLPIANPRYMMSDWTFGIKDDTLQEAVDEARAEGARVVVVLSHNGMDVDLKMASRVTGVDAILGGHTHDVTPRPSVVSNGGGRTLVVSGGSHGKFLGVLDFAVGPAGVTDFRYRLMPIFANMLAADAEMAALIEAGRAPYAEKLSETLAKTETLLYRRGNFNGVWDQIILDALMAEKDAEIAFSPGFRWGPSVPAGEDVTMEDLLAQTAMTYPYTTLTEMTGETLKIVLEDICDNLFNPDPYLQQGGDMVRVGGMTYACAPAAERGDRIRDMRLNGEPIEAAKTYRVAGWAPVSEEARDAGGEPIFDLVARYLRNMKTISGVALNEPDIIGMDGNPGFAKL